MIDILFLSIGILGFILLALVFILEIINKLDKDHHMFSILNLVACVCLFSYALYSKVWLFTALNGFLILTSFYGVFRAFKLIK